MPPAAVQHPQLHLRGRTCTHGGGCRTCAYARTYARASDSTSDRTSSSYDTASCSHSQCHCTSHCTSHCTGTIDGPSSNTAAACSTAATLAKEHREGRGFDPLALLLALIDPSA